MKFRKKPVVIEAMQFVYSDVGIKELQEFCGPALGMVAKARHMDALGSAQILTLEDGGEHFKVAHVATEGDWIIKGVIGEFYACKHAVFEKTYEAIE